jgi:hypothetical protein
MPIGELIGKGGICDCCGKHTEKALYALDCAPLAGGAICEDCKTEAEYAKFVESMVPHCRCDRDRPCAGVLAGGLCDDIRDSDDDGGVCGMCDGSGKIDAYEDDPNWYHPGEMKPCPQCGGTGK